MFYCSTRISAGDAWGGELPPEWDKFIEMAGTFCYNHKYVGKFCLCYNKIPGIRHFSFRFETQRSCGMEVSVKKIYWNDKGRKTLFLICLAISFLAIWIYNFMTPLMSDDLLFRASDYSSPLDIFRQEYKQYMTWTGRSVLQIILKVFSLTPKWIFATWNMARKRKIKENENTHFRT